ncbi:RAD50-interacting protein 1 [Lepeophtheirus salmonis]|uniref:RAD50-interacting protein 1 n=1 Tax=Lepeophtheirus salmonis TaxID=72036 RepID=UPI003AF36926
MYQVQEELSRVRERLEASKVKRDSTVKLLKDSKEVDMKMSIALSNAETVLTQVEPYNGLNELMKIQSLQQILKWIHAVEILEVALSDSMEGEDKDAWWSLLPSLFGRLRKLRDALSTSGCGNLKSYVNQVTDHWKETLITHFNSILKDLIQKLQWPQIIQKDSNIQLDPLLASRFTKNFAALDFIREDKDAIDVLVEPLHKRFKFHFMGNKKTNTLEKPEWYIRQVWKWIKSSEDFFNDVLSHSSHVEFIRKLLEILSNKLSLDLKGMFLEPSLIGHAIDEILGITSDILDDSDSNDSIYRDTLPINVLCVPEVFSKWIDLERKLAFEKLDRILLDDLAWSESSSVPKVSRCAVKFVILLQCMMDRYRHIGKPKLQMQFIELQKELLEDLRLRFVQISREEQNIPTTEKFCLILNSAKHIIYSVSCWSEIPFFMKLECDLDHQDVGLIHNPLGRLDFVVNDMIRTLGDYVFYEVKAQSRGYVYKNWSFSFPSGDNVSSESLPMLQTLLSLLNSLYQKLQEDIFSSVADLVFTKMKDLIVNDVILENKFSQSGCQQLVIDIVRGFLPVFSQYYIIDVSCFDSLNDVSVLLELSDANALLLRETLETEKSFKKVAALLKEFKLNELNQTQVISILQRRILKV